MDKCSATIPTVPSLLTARAVPTRHRRRRTPRLTLASIALAAPSWLTWAFNGHRGLTTAVVTSAILSVNLFVTPRWPWLKLLAVRPFQRYVLNPTIRALLALGIVPLGMAVLETTGRKSGRPRRTPVGEGLEGDTFWIVAEHGRRANYVRNIAADPRVRVRARRHFWPVWIDGNATLLEDDDPHARQRKMVRRHPLRIINATLVRAWGTELLTIRIDLTKNDSAQE
jgi:deazaflavin-dependent oxidoreductase (nitroreductase family)